MSTKVQKLEQEAARDTLRKMLVPGTTVYCSLKHVSRSGMQREITLYIVEDGVIRWITGYARTALDMRIGKRDGIVMNGCGQDMGFALVSHLSHALYPEGFGCIGRIEGEGWNRVGRCPSNDHSNGDRNYTPYDDTAGHGSDARLHWHKSGNYALRSEWL